MAKGRPLLPRGFRRPRKKGCSEHIHGRRKTWLSLCDKLGAKGEDISPRVGLAWWKSPMMKEARAKKWAR